MKVVNIKVIFRMFLLALSCIGLQLGNSQSAMAADCSNATLNGTYLYENSQWKITGDSGAKPGAIAGQEHYNGDGTFKGVQSYSVNGVITRNEAYTGIYKVNSDCTAEAVITSPTITIRLDYFIAPSGDNFVYIATDAGTADVGKEFRVATP